MPETQETPRAGGRMPARRLITLPAALLFIGYTLGGATNSRYLYISFALFAFWALSAFLLDAGAFTGMLTRKKFAALFLYFFFYFCTSIFTSGLFSTAKNLGSALIVFSGMFLCGYYQKAGQTRTIVAITAASSACWLFFSVQALRFYLRNPDAARVIASERDAYGSIAIGGGYGLAVGSAILAVYLLDLLMSGAVRKPWQKMLLLACTAFLALLVVETKSTVTVLCMFLGFALSFSGKRPSASGNHKHSGRIYSRRIFIALSVLFLGFFLLIYSHQIGLWIIRHTAGSADIVLQRIREIGVLMAADTNTANGMQDLLVRLRAPMKSLNSFLQSPVIGRGYEFGYSQALSSAYLGNHCEWADALGSMGLLGGLPFLLVFWYAIREERQNTAGRIPPTYAIVTVLLGLFNPFRFFQPMFAVFFLIPAMGRLISADPRAEDHPGAGETVNEK